MPDSKRGIVPLADLSAAYEKCCDEVAAADLWQATKWIAISGPPSSGKTTCINLLAKLGYPIINDAGRQVLKSKTESDEMSCDMLNSVYDYEKQVHCLMWHSALRADKMSTTFFDYALPDNIAFWQRSGLGMPACIKRSGMIYRYLHVFICEPLSMVRDDVRKETTEEQHHIYRIQMKTYRDLGYRFHLLSSKLDMYQRTSYILKHLNAVSTSPFSL